MCSYRRRSRWKLALLVFLGLSFLVLVGIAGGGCYYARALKDDALAVDHEPDEPDLRVAAVGGGRITLEPAGADDDGDWTKDGIFGLEWEGGYGSVGLIVELHEDWVVREFVAGDEPDPGARVRLDSFAFAGDPRTAVGWSFQDIVYRSPLGEFPAWLVDGTSDTWAIFVHGKGADREEALRMLPAVAGLGLPALVITYRNDEGVPQDGFYRYGETEWQDLQAAVEYALGQGARRVVLVGYSMGGAIVMSFLYQSSLADRVAAVILDSPLLDFEEAVDWGARDRFVPWPLGSVGKAIAAVRYDVHWDELDYLKQTDRLAAPILLFHGDADKKVAVSTSDELAAARPDLVTYVRTPGAGHVRSWNTDPEAYEEAVRDFLSGVVP